MSNETSAAIKRINPPELGTPPGYSLVKLTVFVTDMDNLFSYREARNRFFAAATPPAAPAVTLVEVSKLYGPDFLIEIEANAAV
jgi:enamine deaminase RidA (YjgF/YER057c/UK114 family)